MNASEMREILERDPFQPIRVRLTSGDTYEIRHPHLVVPMKNRLFIAAPDSDEWTLVPYLHIAAVESLRNGRTHRPRRRPRG